MKKISMILFAAVMAVSFAACSGEKKQAPAGEEVTTEQATPEAAPEAAAPAAEDPEAALKAFEEFSKKYVDVINKMKTGDTKVIQEYSKLSGQYQQQVADMERLKVDFTKTQLKRVTDAQDIIVKALASWQGK